jgi:hypothetical protein
MDIIPQRYILFVILVIFTVQLISCSSDTSVDVTAVPLPTSTILPFFLEPATSTPFQTEITTATTIPTRRPKPTVVEDVTPTALVLGDQYTLLDIYDEQLSSNWTLKDSSNVRIDSKYKGYAYSGLTSLIAKPQGAFSKLQFSVALNAKNSYRRDKIAGISFWVSGKDQIIIPNDLVVTVLGSNDIPYWVTNDSSVTAPSQAPSDAPLFSETRLQFLGINRPIEPNTWIQVVLWLDDLIYEPDYTYVTGIYIKNDEQFQKTFYIDKVSLILYAK